MTSANINKPSIGAKVVSRDNIALGTVKEVDRECFKIDAPRAFDYWLGASTIQRVDEDNVVHLAVSKLDVDDFKHDVAMQGHSGIHRHT